MDGLKIKTQKDGKATNLEELFECIETEILQYTWSISDYELWPNKNADIESDLWKKIRAREILWLSGEELIAFAKQIEAAIWGAFLAFEPTDLPISYQIEPYSDGKSEGGIQHPLAKMEIQIVDGGFFELFSREATFFKKLHAEEGNSNWDNLRVDKLV